MGVPKRSKAALIILILTIFLTGYSCRPGSGEKTEGIDTPWARNETCEETGNAREFPSPDDGGMIVVEGELQYGYPEIVVEDNGVIHIVYSVFDFNKPADRIVEYVIIDGGSQKKSSLTSEGDHSLAIDRDGNAHLAHRGKIDPYYAKFTHGEWTNAVIDEDHACNETSIDIDGSGTPHIAYNASPENDLIYATLNDGVWETEIIENEGVAGVSCSLAVDSEGAVHVAYYGARNPDPFDHDFGDYELRYAVKRGNTWEITTLEDGMPEAGSVEIDIDREGRVNIVCDFCNKDNEYVFKYIYRDGSDWVKQEVTGGVLYANAFAMNGETPVIAYGRAGLYYAYLKDGQWEKTLIDGEEKMYNADVFCEPGGKIYIVYSKKVDDGSLIKYVVY